MSVSQRDAVFYLPILSHTLPHYPRKVLFTEASAESLTTERMDFVIAIVFFTSVVLEFNTLQHVSLDIGRCEAALLAKCTTNIIQG